MNPPLKYQEGYRFQVWEDYAIQTQMPGDVVSDFYRLQSGLLIIRKGYAWDGASGPVTIQTDTNKIASLVHDVFFQMLRNKELPHDPCFHIANQELRRLCLEDGMWRLRANYFYRAVESFGNAHAAVQPGKVLTAP